MIKHKVQVQKVRKRIFRPEKATAQQHIEVNLFAQAQ